MSRYAETIRTAWVWKIANTRCAAQGYVLIEYPTANEAKAAIAGANGTKLLDQTISVDYAFVRPPPAKGAAPARGGRSQGKGRARSRSPGDERRSGRDDDRRGGRGDEDEAID